MQLNKYIDHTLLKADATPDQVKKICAEAREYGFKSVCVNSCYAKLVSTELADSNVLTCCVVGFPLGAMMTEAKANEALCAANAGAQEIDMVINIGMAKAGAWDFVESDIRAVVEAVRGRAIVKVIIETCLLTDDEKRRACECAVAAGAHFVKTSTGFSTGGATAEDILQQINRKQWLYQVLDAAVGPDIGVKASGGIRTRNDAVRMIEAGANRIGASASIAIVTVK